jgi:hypothetical protein
MSMTMTAATMLQALTMTLTGSQYIIILVRDRISMAVDTSRCNGVYGQYKPQL